MAKNARSNPIWKSANKETGEPAVEREGRGSFLHLFEKERKQDGTEGHNNSLTMLYPKQSDDWRKDLPEIWKACQEVINAQFPDASKRPPIWSKGGAGKPFPVKNGDEGNTMGVVREEQKGMWCVRMISSRFDAMEHLVNGPGNNSTGTLTEQTCYSGCFFNARAKAFYYDKAGSAGITIGLDFLQMTRKGDRFGDGGGVGSAADAFGFKAEETAATSFEGDDPFSID